MTATTAPKPRSSAELLTRARHQLERARAFCQRTQADSANVYLGVEELDQLLALTEGERFRTAWEEALLEATRQEERARTLEEQKDGAYRERNLVIALLAKLLAMNGSSDVYACLGVHEDAEGEEWDEEWKWVVYLYPAPGVQLSWHIHASEYPLFRSFLPVGLEVWDGHSTETKYERIRALLAEGSEEG